LLANHIIKVIPREIKMGLKRCRIFEMVSISDGNLWAAGGRLAATVLEEQRTHPAAQTLGFEERFGPLVARERTYRENRHRNRRRKAGKLRGCSTPATGQFPISAPPLTTHPAALGAARAVAVPLMFFLSKKTDGALSKTG
jgi:hypothetical protein